MKNYSLLIFIFSTILFSCDFGNQGTEIQIRDQYYIGWCDLKSNRSIYIKDSPKSNYGQTIVSGYVFAVGNDNRYIIAKSLGNSKQTIFHIIDTKGYYHTNTDNNNYWEFFSEDEFNNKIGQLKISKIRFDKIFPKNI